MHTATAYRLLVGACERTLTAWRAAHARVSRTLTTWRAATLQKPVSSRGGVAMSARPLGSICFAYKKQCLQTYRFASANQYSFLLKKVVGARVLAWLRYQKCAFRRVPGIALNPYVYIIYIYIYIHMRVSVVTLHLFGVRGSPERGYFVPACVGSGRWADFESCSRIHACGFRCFCRKVWFRARGAHIFRKSMVSCKRGTHFLKKAQPALEVNRILMLK